MESNTDSGPVETLQLSDKDWAALLEAEANPQPPSPAFIKAMKAYRKAIADGTLTVKE